eukprot:TRINITY_DN19690_c0_g1_i1.p1 TRINITY_DN19690_c0_g1~~TRINITY_DN19690_c0_g1_i1.p1  ORF type:complete len:100 (+),score=6.87 TRINITY_DN19690_c0_g1_i1:40-339(+)
MPWRRDDIDAISKTLQQRRWLILMCQPLRWHRTYYRSKSGDNKAMVQALIDLGADVDQSSSGDGNPLITAAMSNNLELAELLIDNGAALMLLCQEMKPH